LSISVPAETEATIRAAAEAAGVSVSTWIAQVAERAAADQAVLADGLAALREYQDENGALDRSGIERAAAELMAAGVFGSRRAAG
jgi:hypothetical protein